MKSYKKTSFDPHRPKKFPHRNSPSEVTLTDMQIAKANRTLNLIRECNNILQRANDESQLLREMCLSIIEYGGYRFVWVGYVEHDEAKTVRAVAKAGYESGYLQSANITWDDTERGRGPVGTAIRSGRSSAMRDVHTNPAFAPWRQDAMLRGYQSVIAIPLIIEGQIIGSLNVYSYEPDGFDSKEVDLLTQLAGKLASNISALRQRVKHKIVE